jgi:ERCC4-related helicase
MSVVIINNITPGATLADDVSDKSGRILLRANAVLNEKQLKILKTWGITEASINSDIDNTQENKKGIKTIDPAVLAAAKVKTTALFRHANLDHPAMEKLHEICTNHLTDKAVED